jgi:hypothetical protein
VRDAAREGAHGLVLLRLAQPLAQAPALLLDAAALGDVAQHADHVHALEHVGAPPLGYGHGVSVHRDRGVMAVVAAQPVVDGERGAPPHGELRVQAHDARAILGMDSPPPSRGTRELLRTDVENEAHVARPGDRPRARARLEHQHVARLDREFQTPAGDLALRERPAPFDRAGRDEQPEHGRDGEVHLHVQQRVVQIVVLGGEGPDSRRGIEEGMRHDDADPEEPARNPEAHDGPQHEGHRQRERRAGGLEFREEGVVARPQRVVAHDEEAHEDECGFEAARAAPEHLPFLAPLRRGGEHQRRDEEHAQRIGYVPDEPDLPEGAPVEQPVDRIAYQDRERHRRHDQRHELPAVPQALQPRLHAADARDHGRDHERLGDVE